jgi:lysophospholipid acyltransferase (LPLAT)-like uncharacterized protein
MRACKKGKGKREKGEGKGQKGPFVLTRSQRLQTRLIAAAASPLISGLCRTVTWTVEGLEYYDEAIRSGRPPIIAFWHGRILPGMWVFRNRGIVVMASANFDGQWIARIIEHFGYRTVTGSSSRGGARALLEMKRELERGYPVAFASDGPRGPARVAQPGALWLAGATGTPILPFHSEASRCWTTRSWDNTQVPKPFSTVASVIGKPVIVADTTEAAIETGREMLDETLKQNEARARQILT